MKPLMNKQIYIVNFFFYSLVKSNLLKLMNLLDNCPQKKLLNKIYRLMNPKIKRIKSSKKKV